MYLYISTVSLDSPLSGNDIIDIDNYQGESINTIEDNVTSAANRVEDGVGQLKKVPSMPIYHPLFLYISFYSIFYSPYVNQLFLSAFFVSILFYSILGLRISKECEKEVMLFSFDCYSDISRDCFDFGLRSQVDQILDTIYLSP